MLSQITAGSVTPGLGWPVVDAAASPTPVGWQGLGGGAVPRETTGAAVHEAQVADQDAVPVRRRGAGST